jgi:hypothetical protein
VWRRRISHPISLKHRHARFCICLCDCRGNHQVSGPRYILQTQYEATCLKCHARALCVKFVLFSRSDAEADSGCCYCILEDKTTEIEEWGPHKTNCFRNRLGYSNL